MARLSLLLLAALTACQAPPERAIHAITNGQPDELPSHRAVVALVDAELLSFCSGTYVGRRTVVSAAHCLTGGPPPSFVYFGDDVGRDGDACFFSGHTDALACGRFYAVFSFADPGYNDRTLENDLAVLRISQEPVLDGQPVAPMPFVRFADQSHLSARDEGALVSFSGFGVTGFAEGAPRDQKLLVEDIPLVAVGPDETNSLDRIDENQVIYSQAGALGGPCGGDSGGPMFFSRAGVERLAAVTSFGDARCQEFGVSTRVDQFDTFIEAFCGASSCQDSCGNHAQEEGESCDGRILGGLDCASLGFAGGTLACHANCAFDTRDCAPRPGQEVCLGSLDEDGDSFLDCDDDDCRQSPACADRGEVCDNHEDDDGDGRRDCRDEKCAQSEACRGLFGRCSVPAGEGSALVPLGLLLLLGVSLRRRASR